MTEPACGVASCTNPQMPGSQYCSTHTGRAVRLTAAPAAPEQPAAPARPAARGPLHGFAPLIAIFLVIGIIVWIVVAKRHRDSTAQQHSVIPPPPITYSTHVKAPNRTFASQVAARSAACRRFTTMYTDLQTHGPMGTQIRLVREAERMAQPLLHVQGATPEGANRQLLLDMEDVMAYVGRSDFPEHGNALAPVFGKVQEDCS